MSHSPAALPPWKPMGQHLYHIDADTLHVRTRGDTTLDDTIFFTNLCRQLIAQNGYVLNVVDLSVAGSASPEARRYQAKAAKEFPHACNEMAIFGMSRLVGVFVQLSVRATSLMTGRDAAVSFVSDEAAALRWRDERRPVLQARFGRNRST